MIEILRWLSKNPLAFAAICTFGGSTCTAFFGWLGIRHKAKPELGAVVTDQATLITDQVRLIFAHYTETISRLERKCDELTFKLGEAEAKIDTLTAQLSNGDLRQTFQKALPA